MTSNRFFSFRRRPVDRNSILGWRSVSRKSADRRCPSRVGSPVSMLAASMLTSAQDLSGSSSTWIVPANEPERPRTPAIVRCRMPSSIEEWTGSMPSTVPPAGIGSPSMVLTATSTIIRHLPGCGPAHPVPNSLPDERPGGFPYPRRPRTLEKGSAPGDQGEGGVHGGGDRPRNGCPARQGPRDPREHGGGHVRGVDVGGGPHRPLQRIALFREELVAEADGANAEHPQRVDCRAVRLGVDPQDPQELPRRQQGDAPVEEPDPGQDRPCPPRRHSSPADRGFKNPSMSTQRYQEQGVGFSRQPPASCRASPGARARAPPPSGGPGSRRRA